MGSTSDDEYRLHALRKVREQQESERKRGLADAVNATAAARDEVTRREAAVDRARAAVRDAAERAAARAAAGDASVHDMVGARHYRERLEEEVARAQRAVAEAEAEVELCEAREDEAREALADAARERKAVEVHYERWQAERAKQRARKEEEAADDVSQTLHRRDK